MNTVTFEYYGDTTKRYNSYEHLDLILSTKTIGAALVKSQSVDIPCGDGELDYTEYFGAVNYQNRFLSFSFSMLCDKRDYLKEYSRLQNLFNGRKMKITLSDDADFYYIGRVSVNDWQSQKAIGKITIDVNAEPYKLKQAPTVIYREINEETVITCRNLRKTVIPKISFTTVGALGCVVWNGEESHSFNKDLPDDFLVSFTEGENIVTVKPSGGSTLPLGVMIEYQEGSL